ncbi:MAG: ABC transporter permease subunit [Cypionkella sp.]|nr:ABC transporter permease subunit [Cypionkella sp.]
MAMTSEAPKGDFRLSMLIYDTRYRAMTIQVIVLGLFIAFVIWLLLNLQVNLAAKDKDINFTFLWNQANYDIGQQLIPFSSSDSHGRAYFVGLLNTLVVSFFACIAATVIGVTAGVLRLSKNWLVGRLMTVYVEVFRNIPLLLWIILAFTVFSETLPEAKDFKTTAAMVAGGTEPPQQKWFFDTVAFTNRGTNIPAPLVERPLGTVTMFNTPISLTLLASLAIIAGSIWGNRRLRARAKAVQEHTGIRPTTWWKSLLILGGPIVLFLLASGFHLEIPAFPTDASGVSKGFNFQGGITVGHSFMALFIALSIYHGTYIAEAVRGGIQAISRGQTEAASALGLRPNRTMSLVVLPQALRVIIPPLISQYLNITKNSTLGMAISYMDLKGTLGGVTLNQTGRELECMLLMMLTYLVLSLLISVGMNIFNNSVKLKER